MKITQRKIDIINVNAGTRLGFVITMDGTTVTITKDDEVKYTGEPENMLEIRKEVRAIRKEVRQERRNSVD